MSDLKLAYMSATEALRRYRDKSLSPVEATQAALARMDAIEPKINAFMTRDHETALGEANASEARWAKGEPIGPLDGVSVTIKDLIPMKDRPLRNGSATRKLPGLSITLSDAAVHLNANLVKINEKCLPNTAGSATPTGKRAMRPTFDWQVTV